MLWSERKRLAEIAEREAAGDSLWTDMFVLEALTKIADAWAYEEAKEYDGIQEDLRRIFAATLGRVDLETRPEAFRWLTDTDLILNYIEAVWFCLKIKMRPDHDAFEERVNGILNSHRIAFRMVEGRIVPFSSDELHVEVVEPTLRLLMVSQFSEAHAVYLKALKEIAANDAADAITDAGTALQATMKALGLAGHSLGAQITDAKKRDLLAPHDQKLAAGIEKFLDWASADRSETGEAHHSSDAELADAWLMVHVVGALIVRLAGGTARPQPKP